MTDPAPQDVPTVGTRTTDIFRLLLKYSILLVASAYAAGFMYMLAFLTNPPHITTWTDAFLPRQAFSLGTLLIGLYVTAIAPIWFASYPSFPYPNWFSVFTTVLYVSAVVAINWKSDSPTVFKLLPLVPLVIAWIVVWGHSDTGKGRQSYRTLLWIAVGLIYFSLTMGYAGSHHRQYPPQVSYHGSTINMRVG
jgi:hypothetical protein